MEVPWWKFPLCKGMACTTIKAGKGPDIAGVAQLVERQLPKLNVGSSNLLARFGN